MKTYQITSHISYGPNVIDVKEYSCPKWAPLANAPTLGTEDHLRERAYESAVEEFWDTVRANARDLLGCEVHAEGRSGGWMVLDFEEELDQTKAKEFLDSLSTLREMLFSDEWVTEWLDEEYARFVFGIQRRILEANKDRDNIIKELGEERYNKILEEADEEDSTGA